MRSRKMMPSQNNIGFEIMSLEETKKSLETMAKGLECRFTSTKPYDPQKPASTIEVTEVTEEELAQVIQAVGQQWQNEGCGGYRPVMARNLSRLECRRPRATSYATRRRRSWSRSRPAVESVSTSKSTLPPTDHKGSDTSVSSGCSYSPLPPSVVPDFKTPYFEQFHSAFKDCTIRKNPSEGLVMRCDVCRVMRSTNIAETSITVEDMTYVVDTGLHREQRFNPPMGLSLLCMFPTFQANVQQRAGHAGRVRLLSQ
ncbi:hypothetical protein HPB51_008959 [Rhipicephalus microplus]|uniref:Uncharacterized protein n=1 Tax=Rhipicephalus microplus TaxID=6941 RepID=A0A9J6D900_RHIMP|nr:hypothetical protein HPB51_008959 [Rhipicephalus microplus]